MIRSVDQRTHIGGRKRLGAILLSAAFLVTGLSGCGEEEQKTTGGTGTTEESTGFSEFSQTTIRKTQQVENLIDKYFYFEQDDAKREERYYDGILAGLNDPYSVYYTKEEMDIINEDDSGEYVGIGATVSKDTQTGAVYVVKPMRGSPAEAAGLLPEDIFIEIDGLELTSDMELDEVVKHIRGSKNTVAKLKMYRQSEGKTIDFEVPRATVQNITVEYEMLENGFGYIAVGQFIENTADQFREAVDFVTGQGATALIIDMRSNPGGFTHISTQMLDYLINDSSRAEGNTSDKPGLLLEMRDKNESVIQADYCKDGHEVNIPIAVLINANSASAAEIFAGGMQDYKKAILVGTTSYGKGIVQQTFTMNDGSGVKLTIGSYFLPSGRCIHGEGLTPDVEVELEVTERIKTTLPHNKDSQLQKAIEELGGDPLPEEP